MYGVKVYKKSGRNEGYTILEHQEKTFGSQYGVTWYISEIQEECYTEVTWRLRECLYTFNFLIIFISFMCLSLVLGNPLYSDLVCSTGIRQGLFLLILLFTFCSFIMCCLLYYDFAFCTWIINKSNQIISNQNLL